MTRGRVVYSSGPGTSGPRGETPCKRCGHVPCRCEPQASLEPGKQSVHVRFERAGRKGKTVTLLSPLMLLRDDATALLKQLKKKCGSGGKLQPSTTQSGDPCFLLEIQGEHVDRLKTELEALGYKTKG